MYAQLKTRTKAIALEVIKLVDEESPERLKRPFADQILRSSSSVGANYRAACRAKSDADFINKMKIVEEETDETLYWLELLEESGKISSDRISHLKKELDSLIAITVASIKTVRKRQSGK